MSWWVCQLAKLPEPLFPQRKPTSLFGANQQLDSEVMLSLGTPRFSQGHTYAPKGPGSPLCSVWLVEMTFRSKRLFPSTE